ncbi:MAG: hypothetical protein LBP21_07220 [Synergistaceae bacterium]|jgi:hypothetical protein|nr:hypothetical protein [Synergistaceae bacterium]
MGYDGTKLVYFNGNPQWLMPDGSFVPVKHQKDGSYAPGSLYLKERTQTRECLIGDQGM